MSSQATEDRSSFDLRAPSDSNVFSAADRRLRITRLLPRTMPSTPWPRVLCVDDDEDFLDMLVLYLDGRGIECTGVRNATQALSLIQTEHYDLYLLDAGLPDQDGFDLCRGLRALRPDTPVVFFSGWAGEAFQKKGLEAGASAYIAKPYVDLLVSGIKQLFSAAQIQPYHTPRTNRRASTKKFMTN